MEQIEYTNALEAELEYENQQGEPDQDRMKEIRAELAKSKRGVEKRPAAGPASVEQVSVPSHPVTTNKVLADSSDEAVLPPNAAPLGDPVASPEAKPVEITTVDNSPATYAPTEPPAASPTASGELTKDAKATLANAVHESPDAPVVDDTAKPTAKPAKAAAKATKGTTKSKS